MTTISIRDEYAPRFGRQLLTLWSGGFASDGEGSALELPGHDGFVVTLDYDRGRVRVACPAPRTEDNYLTVDAAITAAVAPLLAPRARVCGRCGGTFSHVDTVTPNVFHETRADGSYCGGFGTLAGV